MDVLSKLVYNIGIVFVFTCGAMQHGDEKNRTYLQRAIMAKDLGAVCDVVNHWRKEGVDVAKELDRNEGLTYLMYAICTCHADIVSYLMDAGASTETRVLRKMPFNAGDSALHLAVEAGTTLKQAYGGVWALLRAADANAHDALGCTPLLRLCRRVARLPDYKGEDADAFGELLDVLLAAGADPNYERQGDGSAPIAALALRTVPRGELKDFLAAVVRADRRGGREVVLFDPNRSVSSGPLAGDTPLHMAVRSTDPEAVALLLGMRACIKARGHGGDMPIHTLFSLPWSRQDERRRRCVEIARLVLLGNLELLAERNDSGQTPFNVAAQRGIDEKLAAMRSVLDAEHSPEEAILLKRLARMQASRCCRGTHARDWARHAIDGVRGDADQADEQTQTIPHRLLSLLRTPRLLLPEAGRLEESADDDDCAGVLARRSRRARRYRCSGDGSLPPLRLAGRRSRSNPDLSHLV